LLWRSWLKLSTATGRGGAAEPDISSGASPFPRGSRLGGCGPTDSFIALVVSNGTGRIGLAARAGDAPPDPFMAAAAIACVNPRRMGLMAQDAVLGHPPVGRSGVKCNITRVRMALRVGTGPHRVRRFDLRVWIMTHPAGPAMRIAPDRELGELRRHLMTRQALLEVGT
jgi:hypothetical protein